MSQEIDELTLLMTPCTDKEHLQAWLKHFLGFELPDCTVTKYADSNPLDFVWEVYTAVMMGKPLGIMALSGRDSGKTLSLSVIDLLVFLHDKRDGVHIAMTKAQGMRARAYIEGFIGKIPQLRQAVVKQNNSEVRLNIDGEMVGLEVLPCTPKAAQGAHAAFVSFDELASSMDPMNIKGYRDAHGIAGSSRKGKPAVLVKITSRQSGASLAEEELSRAHKSGLRVIKWTTIDSMEKCHDERSGTEVKPMWVNIIKGEHYTEDEFQKLGITEKADFELATDARTGCHTCPLAVYCQGAAKKQTSTSPILRKFDDVVSKIQGAGSHDWALSQIMSLKPDSASLVYHEFEPKIHMPGWNVMWKRLTGEDSTHDITRELFIAKLKRLGCYFIAGIDFGYTDPATCVVMAIDKKDNIYIVEAFGMVRKDDPEWVELIKQVVDPKYHVEMYCPDSANPSGISLLRKADLPVAEIDKGPGSLRAGINIVKGFFRIPGSNRVTKLFIAPDIVSTITNVPGLIDELTLYSKETDASGRVLDDEIIDRNNHYMDALRYAIYWHYGKGAMRMAFADKGEKHRLDKIAPSGTDLAQMAGVHFTDNRTEFEIMGTQDDSPKDPNDDDDDPDGSGTPNGGLQVAWT